MTTLDCAERETRERETGPEAAAFDRPTTRPDLTHRLLDLSPGQWWSPDGHLRIEVHSVGAPAGPAGPATGRELPYGWVWVTGDLHQHGRPVDMCTVPVRADALPPQIPV